MNCKKGDLCVVVRCPGEPKNVGAIRTCVERDDGPLGPGWLLEPDLPNGDNCIYDHCLKPIRGQKGADETLAWAGNPNEVHACR